MVILGDKTQIINFCTEMRKAKISAIAVHAEGEVLGTASEIPIEFACALPNDYPNNTLIVIGEKSAIGDLDESWARVYPPPKMMDTSENNLPVFVDSLVDELKRRNISGLAPAKNTDDAALEDTLTENTDDAALEEQFRHGPRPKEHEYIEKKHKKDNAVPAPPEVVLASFYIANKSYVGFVDALALVVRDSGDTDVSILLDNVDVVYSEFWRCKVLDVDGLRKASKFIAILGSSQAIMNFRQELWDKRLYGISVGRPDTQNLLFACTLPQHFPDNILLVIGDTSAIGRLEKGKSWEEAEIKMVETSDKFDKLLQRLVVDLHLRRALEKEKD